MTIDPSNARHYLILRAPHELANAVGVSDGFVLLAVDAGGEEFESPLGRIPAHDAQRFLYAGDVARAVQRGSATTKEPGVVVGQRMSSLAGYPHLRLRHVRLDAPRPANADDVAHHSEASDVRLDENEPSGTGAVPRDVESIEAGVGQGEITEPDGVTEPPGAEPEASDERPGKPTRTLPATETREADYIEPSAQDAVPVETAEVGDAAPEDGADESESPTHPDRDPEPTLVQPEIEARIDGVRDVGGSEPTAETRAMAIETGGDDDAFAGVLAELEDGHSPDLGELMDLPRTGRGWRAVVDASTNLKPDAQVRMAQDLVLQLLGEDETRDIGQRWLLELAERLRNRADLLVRLIDETWQYADPQAALQELRNAIRRGSVRISQRSGTAVAPLLRDLARTADDSEALSDAYLAMAEAPGTRNTFAPLLQLLGEVEQEESGGNGERQALGREILQRAYRCANGDDLASLAPSGERYLRALLRQDPVNEQAAESIRPMLEASLAHVDEPSKKGIQDTLRELQATSGSGAMDPAPAAPTEIVKLADALDWVDSASANVEVLPSAYESAAKWGKKTAKYLPQVMESMKAVAEVADAYEAGDIGPDGLYGAFTERGQDFVRKETDHTRQKYGKKYVVSDAQGRKVQLESHLRLGASFRIYLTADRSTRRILVGHVGEHLKGRKG